MLDTVIAGARQGYEALCTPGFIQGFGVMLVLHPKTLRVLAASSNLEQELGLVHAQTLGQPFIELLDAEAAAELRGAGAGLEACFQNPIPAHIGGRRVDLILHAHDGVVFAELEPLAPGAPRRIDLDRLGETAIQGMIVPTDIDALMQAAPAAIRDITHFDRVLLYRFDERYHGQVVAEARRPGVDSFLGMFFPESDIGPTARDLYQQNFCRYIPRINHQTAYIMPPQNILSGKPIDMTFSILRGVAPCHVEYLSNMGVAASMSFSIVSENRLWGLFACHNYEPVQLSYTQRLVCEQIAMLFTARLSDLNNPAALKSDMMEWCEHVVTKSPIMHADPIGQAWDEAAETALLRIVNAQGAAIYVDGKIGQIGKCPNLTPLHNYICNEFESFDRLLRIYDDEGLFYTNNVSAATPFGDAIREFGSGMLIIPISKRQRGYLIWFRPEQILTATWAGNPSHPHGTDVNTKLSPRKSFAAWKEDIRNQSAAWITPEIENAVTLRDALLKRNC